MNNDDNVALWSGDNTSGSHKGKIANSVVINTTEVNGTFSTGNDFHVTSSDATIGATVNQSIPINARRA